MSGVKTKRISIMEISPKYRMNLTKNIAEAIWEEFKSYKEVFLYIDKWHQVDQEWNNHWENFEIHSKESGDIDLLTTLHKMDGDILLKIAIDVGVDTPDFIPAIPIFRNELKSSNETALATFERAFKQVETHPDIAIGLANSALESIIREILKHEIISYKPSGKETLYKLTENLLKEIGKFPNSDMPQEIKTMGSSFMNLSQSIEKLRSEKTQFHGKTNDDVVIDDPIYTYLVLNSVTTIGLFLQTYCKRKFPKPIVENNDIDDLPF